MGNNGSRVQFNAGNDLNLAGFVSANDSITARAGQVGGNGNITGDAFTYLKTGSTNNITITAGTTTGNIDLPSGWLETGTITMTASQGSINNYKFDNGQRQHGVITANTTNLIAKSGINANVKTTTLNANNTSTGNIDLTVDKNSISDVATTVVNNNGNITINANSGIRLQDVRALGTGNDIKILGTDVITVDRVQAANILTLNTNSVLTLDLDAAAYLSAGNLLDISAGSITRNNTNRISANTLEINTVNGNFDLYTQANNLSLVAGGAGNAIINNSATNLNLTSANIGNGDFTLTTTGTLTATSVKLINNSQAHTFSLTSNGNMIIGQIDASLFSDYDANGNLISASQINLTANNGGNISALNGNDGIAELISAKASLTTTANTGNIGLIEVNVGEITANAYGNVNIKGVDLVGGASRTLSVTNITSATGDIIISNRGTLKTSAQLTAGTGRTIDLSSDTADLVIDLLSDADTDKLLSSQVLKLSAAKQLNVDPTIVLEAGTLDLEFGKSGLIQGSIKLPTIRTDNLSLEVGSGNIVISSTTFSNLTAKTTGGQTSINLVARGNQVVEGAFIGNYRYRDYATRVDYYLDKPEESVDAVAYKVVNNNLVQLTNQERAALILVPVLNSIQTQIRETQSGKYIYTGNDGRDYYRDKPTDTVVYTRQRADGQYAYTVFNLTQGAYQTVYSTESSYTVFAANNTGIYGDVQIKFTAVANPNSLNLQSKMYTELAGAIQLAPSVGETTTTSTTFSVSANKIVLNAQRDLANIDFQRMSTTATRVEISTGGDLTFNGSPSTSQLVVASTGYFDGSNGNLVGGNVRTASGTVLNSANITANALRDISVATGATNLIAKSKAGGSLNITGSGAIVANNVQTAGSVNITSTGTITSNYIQGTVSVNLTGTQIISGSGSRDIEGGSITLKASSAGIGSSAKYLQMSAKDLTIYSRGSAYIDNYGALTTKDINVPDGGAYIRTHSPLTIDGNINASGNISLTANDSASTGDDLLINGNASIQGGNITLEAGDNITLSSSASIISNGQVIINADLGTADVGVGNTVALNGNIDSASVVINTGNDADTVTIVDGSQVTTINTQGGDYVVNLGSISRPYSGFTGIFTVNGGTGSGSLNVDNSGDTIGRKVQFTPTQILGLGTAINYNQIQDISLQLGSGNDFVTAATGVTASFTFDGNGGSDVYGQDYSTRTDDLNVTVDLANFITSGIEGFGIVLGSGNDTVTLVNPNVIGVSNIFSIQGNAGSDRLKIDYSNSPAFNQSVTIYNNYIDGLNLTSSLQYNTIEALDIQLGSSADNITLTSNFIGTLDFKAGAGNDNLTLVNTQGQTTLNTEAGMDTIRIQGIKAPTVVNAGDDNDTIQVYDDNNTVNKIQAQLTINGDAGSDRIIVTDVDGSGSGILTSTELIGLGIVEEAIIYSAETLDINLGSGADIFTIDGTHTGKTTLNTNSGDDLVTVNNAIGNLEINTEDNNDFVIVNRTQAITNINTGSGEDNIRIKSINAVTTVNAGTDNDIVEVFDDVQSLTDAEILELLNNNSTIDKSLTEAEIIELFLKNNRTINNISAQLIISGDAGNDTITVSDTGDTSANSGTVTNTNLIGLGMTNGIAYSNAEILNIELGSGADTFTIESTHNGQTDLNTNAGDDTVRIKTISGITNVNTGNDNDSVLVADNNNTVNNIAAQLTLDAAAGTNTLTVNDSGDTTANTGTLTSTRLTGLGLTGGINYNGFQTLDIQLGIGSDNFTVNSTTPNVSQLVMINAADGNDNIQVAAINGLNQLVILGGAGDDMVAIQQSTSTNTTIVGDKATIQHANGLLSQVTSNGGNGNDIIILNNGTNTVIAGLGNDTIKANNSNRSSTDTDMIFGDEAELTVTTNGYEITSTNPNNGGNDTVQTADGLSKIVIGGIGDDTITTGAGKDLIAGGNARIRRIFNGVWNSMMNFISGIGTDNDTIRGGDGNDTIYGQSGSDTLYGEAGDDWLRGDEGSDFIDGGTGIDRISYDNSTNGVVVNIDNTKTYQGTGGTAFTSVLQITPVVDHVTNLEPIFNIASNTAQDGFNTYDQLANIENITGSQKNDILIGNTLNNQIEGLGGDDILIGNAGNDILEGNEGIDTVSYRRDPLGVIANLATGTATDGFGNTDTLSNIENLIGSAFNDQLTGNAVNNRIYGGAGKDTILGGDGNDELYGEDGNDIIKGEIGNDFLVGGAGIGTGITDQLDGGAGTDTISYYTATAGVTLSLTTGAGTVGEALGDRFISIENVEGSKFNDSTIGDSGANVMSGLSGDDQLYGLDGNNQLYGGDGNDILAVTGNGDNILDGGDGINRFTSTGSGKNTIIGGSGNDTITTGAGDDTIYAGNGINIINAGEGNNTIYGGKDKDTITTGLGNDFIDAGEGDNIINAGAGVNRIYSSAGSDDITSGSGDDFVQAGAGNNTINAGDGKNDILTGDGNDTITTASGDDIIVAGNGFNYITAGDGKNNITGGTIRDDIFTGTGNDIINAGDGDNNIFSGAGVDRITTGGGIDQINAGEGDNRINSGAGNDIITSGSGNDTIDAGEGNNTINAGDGVNIITAGSGKDTITTGVGDDIINAGDGDNIIYAGNGLNRITAGSGSDTIASGNDKDIILAGEGNNVIDAGNGDNQITTGAGNDRITTGTGSDTIDAGEGNNTINAGDGVNIITAGSGKDTITTGVGDDIINAGDGDNIIYAGNGLNRITAGSGSDTIASGNDKDIILAGEGNNVIDAGNGDNQITTGAGNDRITTGTGSDVIIAGNGYNYITTGNGNKDITGGDGRDDIFTGSGDDVIRAGNGANNVTAGSGIDNITTGSGNDTIDAGNGNNTVNAGDGDNTVTTGDGNDSITTGSGNDFIYYGDGIDVINAGNGVNVTKKFKP